VEYSSLPAPSLEFGWRPADCCYIGPPTRSLLTNRLVLVVAERQPLSRLRLQI